MKRINSMEMVVGGIDGCSAGWLLVYAANNTYKYAVLSHISEIEMVSPKPQRILIDMPIGLTSNGFTRTIEASMRKVLSNRSSTVFNAPVRAAVYATTKIEARAHNIALTGKSLSEQSLNIAPKIKEIDAFLQQPSSGSFEIYESHPEICFRYLAGRVLQTKKSTKEGIAERIEVLATYEPRVRDIYAEILNATLRKDVKRDDITDALCLCIVNSCAGDDPPALIKDGNTKDEQHILVRIAYFQP